MQLLLPFRTYANITVGHRSQEFLVVSLDWESKTGIQNYQGSQDLRGQPPKKRELQGSKLDILGTIFPLRHLPIHGWEYIWHDTQNHRKHRCWDAKELYRYFPVSQWWGNKTGIQNLPKWRNTKNNPSFSVDPLKGHPQAERESLK